MTDNQHSLQTSGLNLTLGDAVLINDRSRELIVTGRHSRQQTTSTWKHRGESKYHTVIELEGNNTEYHLLCTGGATSRPMLYKGSEIKCDETNELGVSPAYKRGTRLESIEVVDDTQHPSDVSELEGDQ